MRPCSIVASLVSLVVLFVSGCEKEVADAPPTIRLGHDLCVHCNMIISDARHAASALVRIDDKRKAVLFDDIGDLIDYQAANQGMQFERTFVTDFDTRQWVEFGKACFVVAPEVHTPMGSGFLAFASPQGAAAAANVLGGQVKTPEELVGIRTAPKASRASATPTTKSCCPHE
jgi:copper chaperone NosL